MTKSSKIVILKTIKLRKWPWRNYCIASVFFWWIDMISTLGPWTVAQYGAWHHTNAIAAFDNRSCCIIHRAVPHTQLYGLAESRSSDGIDWCCFHYFVRNSLVALLEARFVRKVCPVVVPCMHRNGSFCLGSRIRRQPAPHVKPLPIMFWDHRPRNHSAVVERQI